MPSVEQRRRVNNAHSDRVVVDASAVLAYLNREQGKEMAAAYLEGAVISAVNLAEVIAKLTEAFTPDEIREGLNALDMTVMPFDAEQANATGLLRPTTKLLGLSLGDRACLALAQRLDVPALTADGAWKGVDVGVEIRHIR